jgi:hypothetical protein
MKREKLANRASKTVSTAQLVRCSKTRHNQINQFRTLRSAQISTQPLWVRSMAARFPPRLENVRLRKAARS